MASCLGRLLLLALSAAAIGGVPGSLADDRRQPDQTGTGGGPRSTITAPNTNSLGVTKPPGREDLKPDQAERRELRDNERMDRRLDSEICKGCN